MYCTINSVSTIFQSTAPSINWIRNEELFPIVIKKIVLVF